MKQLASLDLFFMQKELQDLAGARLQKVYQIGNKIFLVLYKESKQILLIAPHAICLTKYEHDFPKKPTSFCMLLRKHLSGKFLKSIEQHKFDRILELDFGTHKLVCEFFSDGNVILLDSDEKIMDALHKQRWKDRNLLPKQPYKHPPESLNTLKLSKKEFGAALKKSEKDLVRTLATTFSLGGLYAEEVCARASAEKNKKCTEVNTGKIYVTVQELFKEKPKPAIYENNTTPIQLTHLQPPATKFKTFSEACDEFFAEEQVERDEHDKIKRILEAQEATLKTFRGAIEKNTKKARELEMLQKFKEAGKFYDKVKKARKKLAGLRMALTKTKKQLDKTEIIVKKPVKKLEKKKMWYEKFRWFHSSDGFLVIGGKDATTNEIVVKKHTEPKDAVFHAEITGAPFCIVKSEGKEIPKTTLEETAVFAASYSKAWQIGLGAVDVYWVKPDQVSKEAPAGEHIGKGAFMIYGRKNYYRNTKLEIAIGAKDSGIIHGPENAVKSKTKNYVLIIPGSIKSGELARKIKSKLKTVAKLDEIQRFVPSGKGRLTR